jgi:membrane protease YdiL (CAAX protease family)
MKLRFQISWMAMVLALAVLAAAFAIIGRAGTSGPLAGAVTKTAQFQIWRLICSLTAACVAALGAQTWVNLARLQRDFGRRRRELLVGAAVLGIVFYFAYYAFDRREIYGFHNDWPPIPAHQTIAAILAFCFFILAVPTAGGMGLVQEYLNDSGNEQQAILS